MITTSSCNQPIEVEWTTFPGGERHVQLNELNRSLSSVEITVQFQTSDDLIDLLLLANALRHQYGNIAINLLIPYLPYARQDRVCAKGQAFSLEVVAQLINSIQPGRVTTWDCHSETGVQLLNAENVTPDRIISCSPDLVKTLQGKDTVLICPDNGAIERCKQIQTVFDINNVAFCEKVRDPCSGKITETRVDRTDLTGKTCVITDDICDGGFTFIELSRQLKSINARKIVLYVTHGIFSKGLRVFDDLIDEIYTSNSIQRSVRDLRLTEITYQPAAQGEK